MSKSARGSATMLTVSTMSLVRAHLPGIVAAVALASSIAKKRGWSINICRA